MRRVRTQRRAATDSRGMALVMVLVLTTILAAVAADISGHSSVHLMLARNARDQFQAQLHARSALELEMFFLRFQGMMKGTLEQFLPIPLFELSGYFVSSDTMKGILKREDTPFEDEFEEPRVSEDDEEDEDADPTVDPSARSFGNFSGSFWIEEVVDENRKININKENPSACSNVNHLVLAGLFADPKYDKLFEELGDSRDPARNRVALIANLTDWLDGNDDVDNVCTLTGDSSLSSVAEDTRYNHLPYGATYKPKNAQYSSLAELRMVPGVNDAVMRLFGGHLTVFTDDTGINVNTADPTLLRAIIYTVKTGGHAPGDEVRFEKFNEELLERKALPPPLNKLKNSADIASLLTAAEIPFDPQKLQQLDAQRILRFDDSSNVYRITAVGRVGEATSTITAVWRDDRGQGELRYYREE